MSGSEISRLNFGCVTSAVEGIPGTSVGDSVAIVDDRVEAARVWGAMETGSGANAFFLSSSRRRVTRVALLPVLHENVRRAHE